MFKILLVEDNLIYRCALKHALSKRFVDLETKEASGGSSTLSIVRTYNPDLIIMDIELNSDVNGLDLTKIIKLEHPEKAIVILSQHDIPEYRIIAQKNGANIFFSKSTSLESIFDYVDSVIEHSLEPY